MLEDVNRGIMCNQVDISIGWCFKFVYLYIISCDKHADQKGYIAFVAFNFPLKVTPEFVASVITGVTTKISIETPGECNYYGVPFIS